MGKLGAMWNPTDVIVPVRMSKEKITAPSLSPTTALIYGVWSTTVTRTCTSSYTPWCGVIRVPPAALYTAVQEKKLLLKQAQPPSFKGEGANVERDAEVWLEAMDDNFKAARTHPQNQTMLAMFRLTGDVKIWWKQHCRDSDIVGISQAWEEIKDAVTALYLPPPHRATKMIEFFSLQQLSSTLEEYYSKFVTLQRYAPKMTLEQQVARFCQGLIEPLNNRLEALRPTMLQDALLRAKPLAKEIKETTQVGKIIHQGRLN
ncbi:hypothetical protein L7F22_057550 [Adiantum nelumboides]|nr:hypothetical protein [Adiantum nelumboides]